MRASTSGSPPARAISPVASASRKDTPASIVNTAPMALVFDPVHGMDAGIGESETFGRADVIPLAVVHQAAQPAIVDRPIPQPVDREGAGGRTVEQTPMRDFDAGENERHDLGLAAPAHCAGRIDHEIARSFVAGGARR